MPNCSVVGCDYKKWPKDGTYQSFQLPTEPNLRKKWLTQLNRDQTFNHETKSASVCIRHFEANAFLSAEENKTTRGKMKKRKSLNSTALPTLFLRPEKGTMHGNCAGFNEKALESSSLGIFYKDSKVVIKQMDQEVPKDPVIIQLLTGNKGGPISETEDKGDFISVSDNKVGLISETDDPLHMPNHQNENDLMHPSQTKFLENKNGNNIGVESVCSNIQPELKSEFKENVYESTFLTNPWDVSDASVFLKYCCPECDYKSDELYGFTQHSVMNHVLSNTLFGEKDLEQNGNEFSIENNDLDGVDQEEYEMTEEFDSNIESVDENPEIVEKSDTTPKISLKALDIFEMSNEEGFVHEGQKLFKCSICYERFSTSWNLNRHYDTVHEGKKPFKCSACDKSFTLDQTLKLHIASVHEGKKPFKCSTCDKTFSQSGILKLHIASVHEEKKESLFTSNRKFHQCSICNISYPDNEKLSQYIVKLNEEKKPFKCSNCYLKPLHEKNSNEEKLKSDYTISDTNPDITSGIKPYKCTICDGNFSERHVLKRHIATVHEGHRPFKCPNCDFSFQCKGNLNKHIESVHERKKPYKCTICDASFSLKGGMKKHIECVHEGIRPHLCFICGAKFYDQKGLNTHFGAVHERKKPIKCPICHDRQVFLF